LSKERLSKLQKQILSEIYKNKALYAYPICYTGYNLLRTELIKKHDIKNKNTFNVSFNRSIKNLQKKEYIKIDQKKNIMLQDYDYSHILEKLLMLMK